MCLLMKEPVWIVNSVHRLIMLLHFVVELLILKWKDDVSIFYHVQVLFFGLFVYLLQFWQICLHAVYR